MKSKIINYLKEFWYEMTTPEHIIYEVAIIEAWVECDHKYNRGGN